MGNLVSNALHDRVEQVKEFQMKQGDQMRQAQLAMGIATARDQLQWGAGLYSFILFGAFANAVENKKFSKPFAIPIVIGGFLLSYNYDFCYGNKLIRVRKEAEYILENEREFLVPIKQMPARKFWEFEAKLVPSNIPRVGEKWPTKFY